MQTSRLRCHSPANAIAASTAALLFLASTTRAQDSAPVPAPPIAAAPAPDAPSTPGPTPDVPATPATPAAPAAPAPGAPATAASDDSLERDLARDLATIQPPAQSSQVATASRTSASAGESSSGRGLSNAFNPAISANGLILGGGTSRGDPLLGGIAATDEGGNLRNGVHVQEVELQASAIVDPYFRADVTLASDLEEIGFEEAYLSTLEIPRVTIRAGQMRAAFGRHNLLHTHAFPFLTAPLPTRALFGPEGLANPGLSADVLLPLPFYAEVTAQAFQGEWLPFEGAVADDPATAADESVADRRRDADLAYLGHLKTLFDLSDATTLEIGGTYVGGRNGFAHATHVVGGDITLKWRPIEAERYKGVDWTTEYLGVEREGVPTRVTIEPAKRGPAGGYSALRFLFAQRWWLQARGALLGEPKDLPRAQAWRAEALVAFVPSEFSALRLQYAIESERGARRPDHEVFLQAIFSIGPHPAHAY